MLPVDKTYLWAKCTKCNRYTEKLEVVIGLPPYIDDYACEFCGEEVTLVEIDKETSEQLHRRKAKAAA